ncbi:adenosylcobinamide amidohydrolase [Streptomyces erythrochromogenes]|uniref:adenosylcobinamide amidohydrolase n=1 Tax=Streptomyces erythrochromogenes TaxID=285574 RepID=UPI0033E66F9D
MLSTSLESVAFDRVSLISRREEGGEWPMLMWMPGPGRRMISSAPLGGGIGERRWVLNAQVPHGYRRMDPHVHLAELASAAGASGPGVGLMTAASVAEHGRAADGGAWALASAGLGVRGWAADPAPGLPGPRPAGTINIIASVPVAFSDAALVNAVATATEAKVQALLDAGVDASGTPTDAVCVAALEPSAEHPPEAFAGPRSLWGARLARAVHRATLDACMRPYSGRTNAVRSPTC